MNKHEEQEKQGEGRKRGGRKYGRNAEREDRNDCAVSNPILLTKLSLLQNLLHFRMIRVCIVILLSGLEILFFCFTIEWEGPIEVTVAAVQLPSVPVR